MWFVFRGLSKIRSSLITLTPTSMVTPRRLIIVDWQQSSSYLMCLCKGIFAPNIIHRNHAS